MAESTEPTKGEIGTPTVVVSHLDVKYAVYGGGRRGTPSGQGEPTSLRDRLTGKRPPKVREVHAVKDVSFVAHHGESIGIIGRNGSGKSTLLRAVAGLIPPSAGRLWVSGEPSLLGVNAVLMNKLSGERNIYIGAQALGLSKAEIAERFDEIVEFSGIGDAVYLPMGTYSSGMGARLRFAISTAASPDVLMIDEALATGDADFRQKSAERITDIRDRAGTVFLVSHSNGNIRQICDRVLWMDQGRLLMDGPTEEVLPQYEATLPKKSRKKTAAPPEPDIAGTQRWGGDGRIEVSTAISAHTWEPGVEGVFVVSVHKVAAARAVAPVAARLGWPLLWVRPGSVPEVTREELLRLAPQRVVVVAGEEQLTEETHARLEEMVDAPVERIASDDPAVTSARLLRAFPPEDTSTLHVTLPATSNKAPAVSLAAGAAGQALVVCDPAEVPEELATALSELAPERLVLGGNEEDWPVDTVDRLRSASGGEIIVDPGRGPMALATTLWDDVGPGGRVLVTAQSTGVEILTATAASGYSGAPVLLVTTARVPQLVRTALERLAPREIVAVGTIDAVPTEVRQVLGEIVAGRHTGNGTGTGTETTSPDAPGTTTPDTALP